MTARIARRTIVAGPHGYPVPLRALYSSVEVLAGLSALCAVATGAAVAARARKAERTCRSVSLREARTVALARRLALAAGESSIAVYATLDGALRECAPAIDALVIWAREGDRLIAVHTSGARYERYAGAVLAALDPRSPVALVARDGRARRLDETMVALHPSDRAALIVPLDPERGIVVYLSATHFDAQQATSLEHAVALAEPALRLAGERDCDRARATFDGLTGLLTPHAFRRQLVERLQVLRHRSASPRAALVFVDTDRFKLWNDTYGHASGDALLRSLAQMFREHAPGPFDLVARNGGDEFCLVWCECEKSTALQRAEALRRAIASAPFASSARATDTVRITASIGVAAFPCDASGAEALLESADAAMYASKRAGRDRVAFHAEGGAIRVLAKES